MKDKIVIIRIILNSIEITLAPRKDSRELNLAFTHLQEGSMWLGKVLGTLGKDDPYPESSNPENKTIEKRADTADEPMKIPLGRIEGVKAFRRGLKEVLESVDELRKSVKSTDTANYLLEAKLSIEMCVMWLGMELNRIKIEQIHHERRIEEMKKAHEERLLNMAKSGYEAYGRVTDFKNFQGNPMPEFDELTETIKKAWAAVGELFSQGSMSMGGRESRYDIWEDANAEGVVSSGEQTEGAGSGA